MKKTNANGSGSKRTTEATAKTSKSEELKTTTEAGKATPKGAYLGSPGLDKAIADFCRRSSKRQKNSFHMGYEEGDDLRKMISLVEGKKYAHLKRRPNNADPFEILARHPECFLGMKQMRRYVLFADTVDAIKKAGYEAPILGLTYYVEGARLKSVESIVETLNQVVKDDHSVRELIEIVDQIMPPKRKAKSDEGETSTNDGNGGRENEPLDWKKSLEQFVGSALKDLAPIAQKMADKKAKLDKETANSLRKLGEKIQDILRRAA